MSCDANVKGGRKGGKTNRKGGKVERGGGGRGAKGGGGGGGAEKTGQRGMRVGLACLTGAI